jgi:hypothetical protein
MLKTEFKLQSNMTYVDMHHIHQRGIYVDEMLTQRRKYERYGIDCHRLHVEYWEGGIFVLTADRQYQLFCIQGTSQFVYISFFLLPIVFPVFLRVTATDYPSVI